MIVITLSEHLHGRSLYWLSQTTGVRWAHLRDMSEGTAKRMDLTTLEKICVALRVKPGDLLQLKPKVRHR